MLRTLSSRIPEISLRQGREIWCSVTGRVFVKLVTPAIEGISNQAQMSAWKMGKEWRHQLQALMKKFL